jgi:hypothetical protein
MVKCDVKEIAQKIRGAPFRRRQGFPNERAKMGRASNLFDKILEINHYIFDIFRY